MLWTLLSSAWVSYLSERSQTVSSGAARLTSSGRGGVLVLLACIVGGWCSASTGALLFSFWLHNSARDASRSKDSGRSGIGKQVVVGLVPWGLKLVVFVVI